MRALLRYSILFTLSVPNPAGAADKVTCPPGTQAIRTVEPRRSWACAVTDKKYASGIDCPSGTSPVTTTNPYDPFKCALNQYAAAASTSPATSSASSKPTYKQLLSRQGKTQCPKGYTQTAVSGKPGSFECLPDEVDDDEPSLSAGDFQPFQIPGEARFEVPIDWNLADRTEEIPSTVLIEPTLRRQAALVRLSVIRRRIGDSSYVDPQDAVKQERKAGAKDLGARRIAGRAASVFSVPQKRQTAYVRTGDGYFVLSYEASPELYSKYVPAFERLIHTFRILEQPANK